MEAIIVGINATYSHRNLAVRYIAAYLSEKLHAKTGNKIPTSLLFTEFSINDREDEILLNLVSRDALIYGFSTYIWNVQIILRLCHKIKILKPESRIILGGPEVSYEDNSFFEKHPYVDFIISGPGEKIFADFVINPQNYVSGSERIISGEHLPLNEKKFPYLHLKEGNNSGIEDFFEGIKGDYPLAANMTSDESTGGTEDTKSRNSSGDTGSIEGSNYGMENARGIEDNNLSMKDVSADIESTGGTEDTESRNSSEDTGSIGSKNSGIEENTKDVEGTGDTKANNSDTEDTEDDNSIDDILSTEGYVFDPNKQYYYEASVGCPFKCSYCLSASGHKLEFLPLDRVKKELLIFIKGGAKIVKLIDRTFNLNDSMVCDIWQFLIDKYHENPFETCFHFEISADLLSQRAFSILSSAPSGIFRFECGIQSTNIEVLKNVDRHSDLEKTLTNIKKLTAMRNIEIHVDMIVGLPGEDMVSTAQSFNDIFELQADMFQLGFLKILKGSPLEKQVKKWGMKYSPFPPYQIMETRDLSYKDISRLQDIEHILQLYYNSGKYLYSLWYLQENFYEKSYFNLFLDMAESYRREGGFHRSFSQKDNILFLLNFGISGKNVQNSSVTSVASVNGLKVNIQDEQNATKDRYNEKLSNQFVNNKALVSSKNTQKISETINMEGIAGAGDTVNIFSDIVKFDRYTMDSRLFIEELNMNMSSWHPLITGKTKDEINKIIENNKITKTVEEIRINKTVEEIKINQTIEDIKINHLDKELKNSGNTNNPQDTKKHTPKLRIERYSFDAESLIKDRKIIYNPSFVVYDISEKTPQIIGCVKE